MDGTKHDKKEASKLRRVSYALFQCRCRGKWPERCTSCILRGVHGGLEDDAGNKHPNYAGWARWYVQAGIPIPDKYKVAFEKERSGENAAFVAALEKDIRTFGVKYGGII